MCAGSTDKETEGMTMARLAGKTALVTGASRGIGRAIAVALAKEGAAVAVNYRVNEIEARRVVEEMSALGVKTMLVPANVSVGAETRAMVQQVVKDWGRIDVMVNSAGITRDKTLRKMTDEDWFEVISTILTSVYYGVTAVMPLMIEQKYGRIINISSFVGQAGNFGQANYSASKGGIIAFTKSAALELAKYNVTCNALAPGFTETNMLAKVPEQVRTQILARIPMGRFGQPAEIAKAVLFLAADADYITGQQINVNGGVYM